MRIAPNFFYYKYLPFTDFSVNVLWKLSDEGDGVKFKEIYEVTAPKIIIKYVAKQVTEMHQHMVDNLKYIIEKSDY